MIQYASGNNYDLTDLLDSACWECWALNCIVPVNEMKGGREIKREREILILKVFSFMFTIIFELGIMT